MIAGGEMIEKSEYSKTLYYGLKLNHPRNVALLHPLMFTIRRLVYTLSIMLLADYQLYGVWLLMLGTCIMLIFAVTEMPWRDPLMNNQYIFNEVTIYLMCIMLLLFNSFVPIETRIILGEVLIGIICTFLVYNGIIMMRKVTRLAQLLHIKVLKVRRMQRLGAEARAISKKIKITLDEMTKPDEIRNLNDDSDLDWQQQVADAQQIVYMVDVRPVQSGSDTKRLSGGLSGCIVKDEIAMTLLRRPLVDVEAEYLQDLYSGKFRWKL